MTTGIGPYVTPDPVDTSPAGTVLETEIVTSHQTRDLGGGLMAEVETYNGQIPGPTLRVNVDDTVIVRLINDLDHPTGIHWHGIELQNAADGTPVTQDPAQVGPFPAPSASSPTGGTYLYKFKCPRPGIFWYHPHHFHSTNRVFRGLYGMIVVADPNEAALIAAGTLPGASDTLQLVLSDTTVCKAPGSNDTATYPAGAPWAGGGALPVQPGPTPVDLCEIAPAGQAMNEDGTPAAADFAAGEIPNIQRAGAGRTNEGQLVLTNGVNVGGRAGSPSAPGALDAGASTYNVQPGQGLRMQIVNCATTRYFRLILSTSTGAQIPLVRVGGEGGLLDNAIVEGGVIATFDTKYATGEILIPPSSRADVVAAIPDTATGVCTMWTQDYDRTGQGFSRIATVPVAHFNVAGAVVNPAFAIAAGTPLRAAIPDPVESLPAATAILLDPAAFVPAKPGMALQNIALQAGPSINGVQGSFAGFVPYTTAPHIGSSRYAEQGEVLELTVDNVSSAHHPFHLHGFSFQPLSLTPGAGAPGGSPSFNWPYQEFRDTVDIPSNYILTFRLRLDDRELSDGVTLGGALGRWLFHCHIFFHAHNGMISEMTVTAADGSEKPNVDVGGSWAYTALGGTATRRGTFVHPDGDAMTLAAKLDNGSPIGAVTDLGGGQWEWALTTAVGDSPFVEYVYIEAEDASGRKDQAVFRLKVGAPDDGSDSGDPHLRTVDGQRYDFQSVGEFTLLRDHEGMEIQTRQTPVATQNPITDSYSGLTVCVSVNTAIAARVGSHTIAYQPGPEQGQLQFYLDGKPSRLTAAGIDLDGHRVSAFDADGRVGLRVDYEHQAVLTVTPRFWTSHNVHYMNVAVSQTMATEGLIGAIPDGSWLPKLRDGSALGPMPESLHDRWTDLYETFANSWRVTDRTSLFVYEPGTSTATFTDISWPGGNPPCPSKPEVTIPGAPVLTGMPVAQAAQICQRVTEPDLNENCVFDVAATGDEEFAQGYLFAQELRRRGTAVHLSRSRLVTRYGETLDVTATVRALREGEPTPTGRVTFFVDGAAAGPAVTLLSDGTARFSTNELEVGKHRIRAAYEAGGAESQYHPSGSPNLLHTVEDGPGVPEEPGPPGRPLWFWILLVLLVILLGWILFG